MRVLCIPLLSFPLVCEIQEEGEMETVTMWGKEKMTNKAGSSFTASKILSLVCLSP